MVEALMLVSLFCIGFASWSITDPSSGNLTADGGIQTESVVGASLEMIGLKATTATTGFQYHLTGTDSKAAEFSNTALTIEVNFNKDKLLNNESLPFDQPYQLLFECTPADNSVNIFSGDTHLKHPETATAHIKGFPNQTITATTTATNNKLSAGFAIKSTEQASIYHLVSIANPTIDADGKPIVTLVFTLEFSVKDSVTNEFVKGVCWSTYNLSFKLGAI